MNKLLLTSLVALSFTGAANAEELKDLVPNKASLVGVYDNNVNDWGTKVSAPIGGVDVGVTYLPDNYNRISLGKEYVIWKEKYANLTIGADVFYQTNYSNDGNGPGVQAGFGLEVPLTSAVSAYGNIGYVVGSTDIKASNGAMTSIGVKVKF